MCKILSRAAERERDGYIQAGRVPHNKITDDFVEEQIHTLYKTIRAVLHSSSERLSS